MSQPQGYFIPYDLLSNFLTRTYLDTLETLCYHSDYHVESHDISLKTIKSVKSFLFIFQNNNANIHSLQKQIFNFFTPYTYLSKNQIYQQELAICPEIAKFFSVSKRSFNHSNLRKIYAKNILTIKDQNDYNFWKTYNIVFIHMHRNLVYHGFKEEASLPKILTASTAEDFITSVWTYYLDYLISSHYFKELSETIAILSQSELPYTTYLISYLKEKLYLIEYSIELDHLLEDHSMFF